MRYSLICNVGKNGVSTAIGHAKPIVLQQLQHANYHEELRTTRLSSDESLGKSVEESKSAINEDQAECYERKDKEGT